MDIDRQHKAIRTVLGEMSPERAICCIQSFLLPEEEERYLIEHDVNGKSYTQLSSKYHVSPELIKKRRRRAFVKIADQLYNS